MDFIREIRCLTNIVTCKEAIAPEPYEQNVRLFSIDYRSEECLVKGYIAVPRVVQDPLPAIIFNRGGNREFGLLQPKAVCRLAEKGYIALGSQYRGNAGGTGVEQFGGKDVADVLVLIDMCEALPFVRQGGVYMHGHSRGGMMTYLCCAQDKRIKAAAIGAGISDCFMMYESREQAMKDVFHELVGGSPAEMPEAFKERSAVCWAEKIIPPVLICQGTADTRVIPQQAYKMDAELTKAGKQHKTIIYEGADHSLVGTTYIDDVIAWFKSYPF